MRTRGPCSSSPKTQQPICGEVCASVAGADLKGSLWALRGNEWNQTSKQQEVRRNLGQRIAPLGPALALPDGPQEVYEAPCKKAQTAWAIVQVAQFEPAGALSQF